MAKKKVFKIEETTDTENYGDWKKLIVKGCIEYDFIYVTTFMKGQNYRNRTD